MPISPNLNSTTPKLPTEETAPITELLQNTEQAATLLFDEADSLFNKRSEITDTHNHFHDRDTKDQNPPRPSPFPHPTKQIKNGDNRMPNESSSVSNEILSTLAWGAIGAALVFFARRTKAGFLGDIAVTAGYGMITKAVSKAVVASLS